jgi:hypothetical protein
MNFQELMKKMIELDQSVTEEKTVDETGSKGWTANGQQATPQQAAAAEKERAAAKAKIAAAKSGTVNKSAAATKSRRDDAFAELGESAEEVAEECGMPPSMADAPKQQDSVTMSVNMNGSGSGGIADLMAILRKIENSAPEGGDEMDVLVKKLPGFDNFVGGEQFANEPDEVYKNVDAVVNPPSNGLNEPTQSYPAAAGGDNPMNIKPRLESLYNQIKNR